MDRIYEDPNTCAIGGQIQDDPKVWKSEDGKSTKVSFTVMNFRKSFRYEGGRMLPYQDGTPVIVKTVGADAAEACLGFRKADRVMAVGEYRREKYQDKNGVEKTVSFLAARAAWKMEGYKMPEKQA